MAKTLIRYVCQQCGYDSPKWHGRCPDCQEWNSLVEEAAPKQTSSKRQMSAVLNQPKLMSEIASTAEHRGKTGIGEFDRVLGGGLVSGSVVLIGGDPGIGKSTILMQVAGSLSLSGQTGLYVTGEESAEQIKLRAERLGLNADGFYVLPETNIDDIEGCISSLDPSLVVIDSVQTMYDPSLESAPATVSQVRSVTSALTRIAKSSGMPIMIIGHVTKEGAIAGPRVLEHMVDTVLYFEGDRHQAYRILRAVKNRFGSTDELGIFEMRETGLAEVANPSETLLSERSGGSGSVVTATVEGTRPLLVEIQALVAPSYFSAPRRMATGIDYNRTMLILAVLEKRLGLSLANKDVYVNVAGGVRIVEPSVDLAVAAAVASSLKEQPIDPGTVVIGEVGLAGEVRGVSRIDSRIREASRLGFERAVIPSHSARKSSKHEGIDIVGVGSVFRGVEAAMQTE